MNRRSRRTHGAVSKGALSLGADIPPATSFGVFRMWVVRRRTLANDGAKARSRHVKKCTIRIELTTTKADGTSQRAVLRILAAALRRSLR
jgi:hypothetical protein